SQLSFMVDCSGTNRVPRLNIFLDIFQADAVSEQFGKTFQAARQVEESVAVYGGQISSSQYASEFIAGGEVCSSFGIAHHYVRPAVDQFPHFRIVERHQRQMSFRNRDSD